MKTIQLINGPFDGRVLEDRGVVTIRMWISEDGTEAPGQWCGSAFYEPNEERTLAFWSHNDWEGILEEVIPWGPE